MPVVITDSGDPINDIRDTFYDAFADLTGAGQNFEGLVVAKVQDPHRGYTVPGITLALTTGPATEYGFGDYREISTTLEVTLIFKESHSKTVDGTVTRKDELAQWYLVRVLEVLNETAVPDTVSETGRSVTGFAHSEPQEGSNFWLYGCVATLNLTAKVNLA